MTNYEPSKSAEKVEMQSSLSIENQYVKIVLCEETGGGLRALIDQQSQRDFLAATPQPLYRLVLARKGCEPLEVTSRDADSFEAERSSSPDGEMLTLTYGPHRGMELRVTCRVTLAPDSPLSKWRIAVQNDTAYGIRAIRYPVLIAPAVLGDSDEDDYYLWGSPWHPLVPRPARGLRKQVEEPVREDVGDVQEARFDYSPTQYPGVLGVQLQAYFDEAAGLYMATYDDAGCIKSFGLSAADEDGAIDLSITHHYDERPGLDFDLPYATVLGVFHGDWYEAADIYKEWAHQQHWCAQKIGERDDIPDWVKEPSPHLSYQIGRN